MDWNWGLCSHRSFESGGLTNPSLSQTDLETLFDFHENIGFWFGGSRIASHFFRSAAPRWSPTTAISILDVQCNGGALSRSLVLWARKRRIEFRILAVDSSARLLELAKARSAKFPEITFDVRNLKDPLFLQAQQFDYVISSSAFQRIENEEIVPFLKTADRLAKRGVLIEDWLRDIRSYYLMQTLAGCCRSPLVSQEAAWCVRRGLTCQEMKTFLGEAKLEYLRPRRHVGFHFGLAGERALVFSPQYNPMTGLAGV
jgi:2-polyprenyl-3-methyl-5-hydroxy-6-metoxy-1,4-benzoquinol methylase